ncbi:MAG: NFACT family protein, partial [Bradymonadia bacterium]
MNYAQLERVVGILNEQLYAASLDAISDGDERWLLRFRCHSEKAVFWGTRRIYLIIDTKCCRFHTLDERFAQAEPKPFTMLLRKHLLGLRLRELRLDEDDRVITMQFGNREKTSYYLMLELTGRWANIYFCDEKKWVLATASFNPRRPANESYQLPAPPKRALDKTQKALPELSDLDYLHALSEEFKEQDKIQRSHVRLKELLQGLQRLQKRSERLRAELTRDLKRAQDILSTREQVDLLAANFASLKKGMKTVRLERFDKSSTCEITLEEDLSPRENIDARYKQLRKSQRAVPMIEERILTAELEEEEISAYLKELAQLEYADDSEKRIENVENSILKAFPRIFAKKQKQLKSKTKNETKPLPYREFFSKTGVAIWVGKSAKHNDSLSFHYAKGR